MKWDYDVYADDVQLKNAETVSTSLKGIEARVKQYGENGWELVSVEQVVLSGGQIAAMVHYFRKQKLA